MSYDVVNLDGVILAEMSGAVDRLLFLMHLRVRFGIERVPDSDVESLCGVAPVDGDVYVRTLYSQDDHAVDDWDRRIGARRDSGCEYAPGQRRRP